MGGSAVEAGEVGAHQPALAGPAPLYLWEQEVPPGRHLPRDVDDTGEVAVPAAGLRLDAWREVAAQGERVERGHGHALAVDRVEAAERITRHQQAGWEPA